MPIGGFVGGSVEKETIALKRALLEIEEISINYGDDPDNPSPFNVTDDSGKIKFVSNPYINVLVKVVDDYADGAFDGKMFYDKLFLVRHKDSDTWQVSRDGKLGHVFRAHPKYGDKAFDNPNTKYDEQDLIGLQFEAETEQREDMHGAKLQGTRIAFKTIGPVPNRNKKKGKNGSAASLAEAQAKVKQIDDEIEQDLTEAEEADMKSALG